MWRHWILLSGCLVGTPIMAEESDWVVLFDGKSLDGWTTQSGQPVTRGWEVQDGCLHRKSRGGHLVSTREFQHFELRFDWKIAQGGNSGVKYKLVRWGRRLWGLEYQLLDDARHRNGKNPLTTAGAMYQLYAPPKAKRIRPAGEWNTARIVVQGNHVEHWLNEAKILEADIGSSDWKARFAKSKYRGVANFAPNSPTKILLQDHGNEVWFRAIKIRPLPASPGS